MSYGAMTGCVLAGWVPPAAVAAWLAWRTGGADSLRAATAGAAIVLAVVLASGAVTARAGARSAGLAAMAFVSAGMVRAVAAAALAAGAWAIWKLPAVPLLVSLLACYVGAWGAECFWLLRAIRKLPGQAKETAAGSERAGKPVERTGKPVPPGGVEE